MAGPMAGSLLAWFGAEVIKVEPPGPGDPVRTWRVLDEDGTSVWWRSLGRNKQLVAIDLRTPDGRDLVRRLAGQVDVLLENFRPGTLERWGLDPETLRASNPGLVVTRVSGFGQDGPDRDRRGFASVCEAVGGLRYVTGHPGDVPVRSNLSIGDSMAAFHAAIGTLVALLHRERTGDGAGQVVDVAITESVLGLMEASLAEYARCGAVRSPSGTTITGVVPTDAYPTADGKHVVIGANGDSIFERLMRAAGREDLAVDPRLADNEGRVAHQGEVDAAIAAWTSTLSREDALQQLEAAGVPAGAIQSAAEIVEDPHFQARGALEEVPHDEATYPVPRYAPRLSDTPGRTRHIGGPVGVDTERVLRERLGLSPDEITALRASGVIEG